MPAFSWSNWQAGVVGKLPAPEQGFGLDLSFTQVTDAGLKELAGLKQLQVLDLAHTRVTDAGLKELAGLKQRDGLNQCARAKLQQSTLACPHE